MHPPIPVIDIFAGPGGLGEGFSALRSTEGNPLFKIKLSIEKDEFAHQTLELRAFYRQFPKEGVPFDYYECLRGNISREELLAKYPDEAAEAKKEAWQAELGKTDAGLVRSRIENALDGVTDWVLIGGPPCQAYSLIGRSKLRGESRWHYARDHRHLLYKQYLTILADHQPTAFVMENVKGLLSSKRTKKQTKNTFELIISDLKHPLDVKRKNTNEPLNYVLFSFSRRLPEGGLEPKDFVVRSEQYGVPQSRHRIFIFGIRSDVFKCPPDNLEEANRVCIEEVIGDLPELRGGLSKEHDSKETWSDAVKSIVEAGWIDSLPLKLKQEVIKYAKKINSNLTRGASFLPSVIISPQQYQSWYVDAALAGFCNHETRAHIRDDLHRYFFAAVFANVHGRSPTLRDFPKDLLPNHENVKKSDGDIIFNDRFRVQVRGKPSTTIVSHMSKDGHYYIHYDPLQCRSLTVREAARLQTFPDNYFFVGNRTQQYYQVGNAVPPLLAKKIAEIVYKTLEGSK